MEKIDSPQNTRIKNWAQLHHKKKRDETGLFLVEGEHLIEEALKEHLVQVILTDENPVFSFEPTILVPQTIMRKLTANPSGAHLIAVCRQMKKPLAALHRVLILDGVQDPGNLGTLIRTAVSFSFDGVICSEDTVDLYNDKVIRSTQGALFSIPVVREDISGAINRLKKDGFRIIATALENSRPMAEIAEREKMAFILGNEGQGVRTEVQKAADEKMRIEMSGFESLNVAVAGGIVMYRYRRK